MGMQQNRMKWGILGEFQGKVITWGWWRQRKLPKNFLKVQTTSGSKGPNYELLSWGGKKMNN